MDNYRDGANMKNIVLIGFMGTGKTAVGVQLAQRLGYRFVDTDHEVEQRAGCSVSALFRTQGEAAFRRLERAVIHEAALTAGPAVIATGGGAVKDPENIQALRRTGILVCLTATPRAVVKRLKGSRARPLLEGRDRLGRVSHLQAARAPFYAMADLAIDTSILSVRQVVEALQRSLSASRIRVELGPEQDRGYPIEITWGGLGDLGSRLVTLGVGPRIIVVTDPMVRRWYGGVVVRGLKAAGFDPRVLIVPAGERAKTLRWAERLYDGLIQARCERQGAILALGGGAVGDLAGFVAATYLRGVSLIQIPTTLAAQVDAGIGGKTGVDHPQAKNLIGVFYQPRLVWCDPSVLTTLPRRDLLAGLAEVVKYGMIADETLLAFLEAQMPQIVRLEQEAVLRVVARSCEIKAGIVGRDEREHGERRILNYGHTFGHAVETATSYRRFRHGEAVAIGMAFAARLAQVIGLCGSDVVERQRRLLDRIGLPASLPRPWKAGREALLAAMALDKKVSHQRLHFILPEKIGQVTVKEVEWSVVRRLLREATT